MPGSAPKTTEQQRKRVLALIDAGRSYSEVAEEVFGEARLRGRVERIVRRSREPRPALPPLEQLLRELAANGGQPADDGDEERVQSWLEQLVPLYGASLKRQLEADLPVRGRELLALAELELRLHHQRQLKQLNALARQA